MESGKPALLGTEQVLVLKLPRSEGRKRPRALVQKANGDEMWVFMDELKEVPNEAQ